MLLPWSHESTELHRRPWVTLALITVCVVVLVGSEQDPAVQQFERTLAEAHDYWQSHPYLEPGELLTAHFGDDGARAREEFHADLAAGRVPIPAAAVEAEQRELDALASDANAALERHVWYRFGLVPAAPRLAGVFGHMFLHAGWAHLLGNLLFLLLTGPFIEDRWGRSVFLLFYLGAGLSAGLLFTLQSPEVTAPLIGASGAVAGAMGAFLVLFATVRIKFAYWLGFFWGTFSAPAWLLLPLWFAGELATARLMDVAGASDGVAYWAHVGGFSFGVLAAGVLRLSGVDAWLVARNAQPGAADAQTAGPLGDGPSPITASGAPADVSPGRLWTAVARMDRPGSLREWSALAKAGEPVAGGAPDVSLRLAGWLAAAGQKAAAGDVLGELLSRSDPVIAGRIAGAARRIDPDLAVRAAQRSAGTSTSEPGGTLHGKVALVQRPAVSEEPSDTDSRQPDHLAPTTPSAPVPAGLPAEFDEQDLDFFETDAIDFSKDDEAWSAGELEVDLGAPGSHATDPFETDVIDLSKDDEAWSPEELELDLGAPGSFVADAAELFDTGAFDLSEV